MTRTACALLFIISIAACAKIRVPHPRSNAHEKIRPPVARRTLAVGRALLFEGSDAAIYRGRNFFSLPNVDSP
uniref:Uncharacterized protein n=1 Tax=mine drainage metagenome TaxID=410659 RepID=E6PD44_9ZZZZ